MKRYICFLLLAVAALPMEAGHLFAADLAIRINNCPASVKAGQNLGSSFQLVVTNKGKGTVKDDSIEIVLKKNSSCPAIARHALYSPSFFDGVLLQGGRESLSVAPGQTVTLRPHGMNTIPWDTPVGRTYYLCAIVIAGDKVKGTGGQSNCACSPVNVTGVAEKPVITGYAERCIDRLGTITVLGRNFGAPAGKAVILSGPGVSLNLQVISWGDSMILSRIPDDPNILDGQQYSVAVRDAKTGEWLSNRDRYLGTCPTRKPAPAPRQQQLPPTPPFLH
ncbi:MAG TPA: hypothetical protein VMJ66_06035 [Geobacteraceae bacterium]|nr:hypothetical protein [Geobacteraceae bacterium]